MTNGAAHTFAREVSSNTSRCVAKDGAEEENTAIAALASSLSSDRDIEGLLRSGAMRARTNGLSRDWRWKDDTKCNRKNRMMLADFRRQQRQSQYGGAAVSIMGNARPPPTILYICRASISLRHICALKQNNKRL